MQAAKAHVESLSIPGAAFTFQDLGFTAKPYYQPRDSIGNRVAAQVCAR